MVKVVVLANLFVPHDITNLAVGRGCGCGVRLQIADMWFNPGADLDSRFLVFETRSCFLSAVTFGSLGRSSSSRAKRKQMSVPRPIPFEAVAAGARLLSPFPGTDPDQSHTAEGPKTSHNVYGHKVLRQEDSSHDVDDVAIQQGLDAPLVLDDSALIQVPELRSSGCRHIQAQDKQHASATKVHPYCWRGTHPTCVGSRATW